MTGVLKFLTIGFWVLIFTIWISDLLIGISADVSDEVMQGIVEPENADIQSRIVVRRIISILILIPAISIFGIIVYSIRQQKHKLFYVGMVLTIIPFLTIGILGLIQESEMPHKNLILLIFCIVFGVGLLKGLREIFKSEKTYEV